MISDFQFPGRCLRFQLGDLGTKINQQLQPVFTNKKIADHLRVTEEKSPLISQQSIVYEFACDLCDVNSVEYTCRHLLEPPSTPRRKLINIRKYYFETSHTLFALIDSLVKSKIEKRKSLSSFE